MHGMEIPAGDELLDRSATQVRPDALQQCPSDEGRIVGPRSERCDLLEAERPLVDHPTRPGEHRIKRLHSRDRSQRTRHAVDFRGERGNRPKGTCRLVESTVDILLWLHGSEEERDAADRGSHRGDGTGGARRAGAATDAEPSSAHTIATLPG